MIFSLIYHSDDFIFKLYFIRTYLFWLNTDASIRGTSREKNREIGQWTASVESLFFFLFKNRFLLFFPLDNFICWLAKYKNKFTPKCFHEKFISILNVNTKCQLTTFKNIYLYLFRISKIVCATRNKKNEKCWRLYSKLCTKVFSWKASCVIISSSSHTQHRKMTSHV